MPPPPALAWYVVSTIAPALARRGLDRLGIEHLCPTAIETRLVKKPGRPPVRLDVERPLWPGYLLIRADMAQAKSILDLDGISRFLRAAGALWPSPLPDALVAALRVQLRIADPSRRPIRPNSAVRVALGPYADLLGRVMRLDTQGRVRLLVSMLGADREIVVPLVSVEALDLPAASLDGRTREADAGERLDRMAHRAPAASLASPSPRGA